MNNVHNEPCDGLGNKHCGQQGQTGRGLQGGSRSQSVWFAIAKHPNLVTWKQPLVVSHNSGGLEVQGQGRLCVWGQPTSWSLCSDVMLLRYSMGRRRLSLGSLLKGANPIYLKIYLLLKASCATTITLAVRLLADDISRAWACHQSTGVHLLLHKEMLYLTHSQAEPVTWTNAGVSLSSPY